MDLSKTCLFDEADGNTVLFRSCERIVGVTEVFSDDPVLVDAGVHDSLGNDLGPLLGQEPVPAGSTSGLVGVAGDADLGVRVVLESLYDLVDLELLACADVPLVDHEEDVPLERRQQALP